MKRVQSNDCQIVDATQQKEVGSWTVGPDILDQQCGIDWIGENEIVSLSLNGTLNVFDKRKGGEAARVLHVRRCIPAACIILEPYLNYRLIVVQRVQ